MNVAPTRTPSQTHNFLLQTADRLDGNAPMHNRGCGGAQAFGTTISRQRPSEAFVAACASVASSSEQRECHGVMTGEVFRATWEGRRSWFSEIESPALVGCQYIGALILHNLMPFLDFFTLECTAVDAFFQSLPIATSAKAFSVNSGDKMWKVCATFTPFSLYTFRRYKRAYNNTKARSKRLIVRLSSCRRASKRCSLHNLNITRSRAQPFTFGAPFFMPSFRATMALPLPSPLVRLSCIRQWR